MSSNRVTGMTKGFALEVKTVLDLCEAVDSPRSLAVYLLLSAGEYEQYLSLSCNPDHYSLTRNFADDYLVTEVLRKSADMPLTINRTDAAISSFWDSELLCFLTNKRVRSEGTFFEHRVRKEISSILGPLNESVLKEISTLFLHGPGATYSVRGRGSVPSDKLEKKLSLTVELLPYAKAIMGPHWHAANDGYRDVVYGSRYTTVPKDAKTDRGICIEPTLNMFVQRGIGVYLRRRLSKFGVDLSIQQQKNRRLASQAHINGLATIDLSMASDSLSTEVVLSYFPEPWVELLTLARCHRCFVDGDWHDLEKFSSMGNGFTFELETLLFLAVCRAIIPREEDESIAVFGDDIIIPTRYSAPVIDTLNFLGFNVNTRKSFLAGSFFESCGSDWFNGTNVRPFHLRQDTGSIPYPVSIANKLRIYSRLRGYDLWSDRRFHQTWKNLYALCPRMWKKARVPLEFGDAGIISSKIEAMPKRCDNQHDGFVVVSVRFRPLTRRKENIYPYLTSLLHGGHSDFSKGREPRRGFLNSPILGKSTIKEWTNGLDWED